MGDDQPSTITPAYFVRLRDLALLLIFPAEKTQVFLPEERTEAVRPLFRKELAAFFAAVFVVWQLTFLYLRVFEAMINI